MSGWTENDDAAWAYMEGQPDYVDGWHSYVQEMTDDLDPGPFVLNAVFTGDRERHEAELHAIWQGPLCVVEREGFTDAELTTIEGEVEAELDRRGIVPLFMTHDETVEVQIVFDRDGEAQRYFDDRYGSGVVVLTPALQPVRE